MAGGLAQGFQQKVLDLLFGNTAIANLGTNLSVALYTVAPTDTTAGTEVTGGNYARVSLAQNITNWPNASAAVPSVKQNGVAITFNTPNANWGTIVAWAVLDAAANIIAFGNVTPNKTVNNGDPAPSFAIGALQITAD